MRVLLVICTVLLTVCSGAKCPAKNNDAVPWGTGADMFTGECKDKSGKCGSCSELCGNEMYSHWMEENCASTCGLCHTDSVLQSGTSCWTWSKGYSDSNVLSRALLVSMNDCRDKCLGNKECTGVFTTSYRDRDRKECVLVKGGTLMERKYMFGATKQCLKDNPGASCADNWDRCQAYSSVCASRCPYLKSLMGMACQKTCKLCVESTYTWSTVEDKKMAGKLVEKNLSKNEATAKCEKLGKSGCAGVTCKATKKGENCKVMASVKKQKKDPKSTSYLMEES